MRSQIPKQNPEMTPISLYHTLPLLLVACQYKEVSANDELEENSGINKLKNEEILASLSMDNVFYGCSQEMLMSGTRDSSVKLT